MVENLAPDLKGTSRAKLIRTTKDIIIAHIRKGKDLVLDEIQNASVNMQVSLQETLDAITLEALHDPKTWKVVGSIILMGSKPEAVDNMLDHPKAPLYCRIQAKVTILPFDTFELCRVYQQLWGSVVDLNGGVILSLFTLLGGRPHLYQKACQAALLADHSKIQRKDLVEALVTREPQGRDAP